MFTELVPVAPVPPEVEAQADQDFYEAAAALGPTIPEAMGQLQVAVNRAADEARAIACEEIRQELEAERQLRVEAEAKAAEASAAPPDELGEISMDFSRDSSGRISSPVNITTGAGNYDMTFTRGKDGRIACANLRPRSNG